MSSGTCSSCGGVADENYSVRHRGCGCMSHVECLPDQTRVGRQCPVHDPNSPTATTTTLVTADTKGGEPRPTDGVDYVLTPGRKQTPGVLSKVASYLPLLGGGGGSSGKKTPEQPTAESLLKTHVPVDTIMKRHGIGLQHMLKEGIDLSDFLKNGYTWNDLLKFKDISAEGPERALQTLVALRTRATHFRDYPKAFPVDAVRAHTAFESRDMCISFGLTFPDDGPLECAGDQEWTARECVKLGLTMEDLMDFGLYYTQQYQDLFMNVSQKETGVLEKKLGTTIEHLQGLVDLNQQQQQQPKVEEEPKPRPKKQQQQQQELIEEEMEDAPEEGYESPPPAQQQQRVYRVPVAAAAAAERQEQPQQKIAHVTPAKRGGTAAVREVRTVEQRAQDRFGRHGAILK